MTQTATVAFIGRASQAPPELQGFINFRAGLAKRDLRGDEPVAVLRLGALDCYHVVLLEGNPSLAAIEKELSGINAVLDRKARASLGKELGGGKGK
ncbi:MAG: DUF749 domain-containing protein [Euryarchaeota archaeon]|nr:DUF749 domain-containing protein [Euryarchaeota archaeon]